MNSVAVLQARTSSSRLPGKVLLPINGIPLAALAAKRAGNTGRRVIVATSTEASDDSLADTIEASGLTCFRGSLDNPLERIVSSLAAYSDDAIVFRLTADNVFPDGQLLDEIEEAFVVGKHEYLCCSGVESGLPYGVSAEITKLKHLRWALSNAIDAFDIEHVTPIIRRRYGVKYFDKYKILRLGLLRCTIDNLDDYLLVQHVFSFFSETIAVPFKDLITELSCSSHQPVVLKACDKLVFGTVQLGLDYGVNNQSGRPSMTLAGQLLRTAVTNGVRYIDTARAYGSSEAAVGAAFKAGWEGRASIITKLSPLSECSVDANSSWVRSAVDASIFESCFHLGVKELNVVMLHRNAQLDQWNGAAWDRLIELKVAGVIKEVGSSVQDFLELQRALKEPLISYIQLPCNLLDWRWDEVASAIEEVKRVRPLTVHVRSALLQGLLITRDMKKWQTAHLEDPIVVHDWLDEQVVLFNRSSVVDLCLAYLRALPWVDGIAVGMENLIQLSENLALFDKPPLTPYQVKRIHSTRPQLSEQTLNPAYWSRVDK